MTTIEIDRVTGDVADPGPTESEVEAQLARITTDLGGALGSLLISLGTRSGLWAALADAGPLTSTEVAARVSVDPALVREWLRAQAAGGYLEYRAVDDTFVLPDAVAAAILLGPGAAIVEACVTMLASMGEGFDEFSEAFTAGDGYGWHRRTAEHWHGTDALTQISVPPELIGAAIAQVPDIAATLAAGGRVVDVGCGFGAPTRAIAALFPSAPVLGIDYHDASIMHARAAADDRSNLRFEVASTAELPGGGYSLITFFDSLHDLGDPRGALVRARAALADGGAVLLFEPQAGNDVADNLNPSGRMFYAISTLACTPNAVAQRTDSSSEPLGGQAGERALRELATEAGFGSVRRLDIAMPMNLVLELRA